MIPRSAASAKRAVSVRSVERRESVGAVVFAMVLTVFGDAF